MTQRAPFLLPVRILLGLAVADALGAATEFKSARNAARHPNLAAGYQDGSPFGFAPGEATDDTQMTIAGLLATRAHTPAVTDVLRRPGSYATRLHGVFAGWAASRPPDIGGQTSRACRGVYNTALTDYLRDRAQGKESAAGNGGLMRAAAPFIAGLRGDALLTATILHTAATHADARCLTDAWAFAALLEKAETWIDPQIAVVSVQGRIEEDEALPHAILGALDAAYTLTAGDRDLLIEEIRSALLFTWDALDMGRRGDTTDPTGFTTHTLRNAVAHLCSVWATASADRYGDAVLRAVRAGGDADTVACVTGALAAAFDEGALARPEHEHLLKGLRIGHAWTAWPDRAAVAAPLLADMADPAPAEVPA